MSYKEALEILFRGFLTTLVMFMATWFAIYSKLSHNLWQLKLQAKATWVTIYGNLSKKTMAIWVTFYGNLSDNPWQFESQSKAT